jgi:hypothetical protein
MVGDGKVEDLDDLEDFVLEDRAAAATAFSAMQQVVAVMSIRLMSKWSLFLLPLVLPVRVVRLVLVAGAVGSVVVVEGEGF